MGFGVFIIILGLLHLLYPKLMSPYLSERLSPKHFKTVTWALGILAIGIGVYWIVKG
jgi:hypothetical protein